MITYEDYSEWLNEFSSLNGLNGQKRNFSSLIDLMNLEINDTLRELNEISDDEYERRRHTHTSFVLTSSFKVATDIADRFKLKKLLNNLVKFNKSNFPAHYLTLNSDLLNNFVSLIDFIKYYSYKRNDDNWILVIHHFNKLFISFLICNINSTRQIQNEVVLKLLEKWLDIIDATNMDDYEEFSSFLQTRTECLFLCAKHKFTNDYTNSNSIPSPIFTLE
jgi:hypothetical protein